MRKCLLFAVLALTLAGTAVAARASGLADFNRAAAAAYGHYRAAASCERRNSTQICGNRWPRHCRY